MVSDLNWNQNALILVSYDFIKIAATYSTFLSLNQQEQAAIVRIRGIGHRNHQEEVKADVST